MVSLAEVLDLKDKLVGLLNKCLETKSSDFSSSLNIKLAAAVSDICPENEDLYFLFTKAAREEMIEICNRINQLLTSVKPVSQNNPLPPPASSSSAVPADGCTTQSTAVRSSPANKSDPSASPPSKLPKNPTKSTASKKISSSEIADLFNESEYDKYLTRGMSDEDYLRTKIAVDTYLKSKDPKPDLQELSERFDARPIVLANGLMKNGVDLTPPQVSRMPHLVLNADQCSLPELPLAYTSLKSKVREQLAEDAEQWMKSGNTEHSNETKSKDILMRLNAEQKRDVLDFYLKHRETVVFSWILEQARLKYVVHRGAMARCLAFSLLEHKSGQVISKMAKWEHSRFKILQGKEELILKYARNHKPEDLCVQKIRRIFSPEIDSHTLSLFLKQNGIQVMTSAQKRAKKLADNGQPYTRAVDPEKAKRYYKNYRMKQKQSTSKGDAAKDGVKARSMSRAAIDKRRSRAKLSKKQQSSADSELDEAVSQMDAQAGGTSVVSAVGGQQYEIRSPRQVYNLNANQFYHYHYH